MAETFGADRRQVFRKIVFPANIPVLIHSLKINIGLSAGGGHRRGIPVSRQGWATSSSTVVRCSSWIW